ncbi:MAG: zinc ABC transporter substrate-binding protein [Bacteroidales bacterium]|nr:zinc ABC transporter substrate-binding protein [Bacteroidales bacterium]
MKKVIIFIIVFTGWLTGCDRAPRKQQGQSQKSMITVSIQPQKYFVERIAGDHFQVQLMIPPGASPVTYDPSPSQMKKLEHSLAYIRIGHIVFEKAWMEKIRSVNPGLKILDQSQGVDLIREPGHSSGSGQGVDPHIWTSPREVKTQVMNIRDFLIRLDSAHHKTYRENARVFLTRIDSLDARITRRLSDLEQADFLIFHPALSYFARDYGLNQISLEHQGKEPTPARIKEVIDRSDASHIKAVFIQKQFSTDEARTIARELDAEVVRIDPLAYDWLENMQSMSRAIADALKNDSKKAKVDLSHE